MTNTKKEMLRQAITEKEVEKLGGPGSGGPREGAGRPAGSGSKDPKGHEGHAEIHNALTKNGYSKLDTIDDTVHYRRDDSKKGGNEHNVYVDKKTNSWDHYKMVPGRGQVHVKEGTGGGDLRSHLERYHK